MKKYIVIKPNTAGLKSGEYFAVGEEVELNEKQALARVNKVRPLIEKPTQAPAKSSRKSQAE